MDRVGIRELRNQVAATVRRAGSGERMIVTVDGVPVAQLGPLEADAAPTLDDLVAAGLVTQPPRRERPDPPAPVAIPIDARADEAMDDLR